ncbi:MAG: hypothetical protein KDE51_05690 [Anaerolineales bacterium]|nr:hypothetical protein [Anaerolineales bacterium]
MSNFVWETDEEDRWEDITEEAQGPPPPPPNRRKWLYAVPILAILLLTGLVIYNQAQARVERTKAAMREDILSSHQLIRLAAAEQDDELLTPMLSGRNLRWVDAIQDAAASGTLFDRTQFGLTMLGEPTIAEGAITFNDNLDAAELTTQQRYQYGRQEITLEHTLLFRLGGTRWLWAPLEDEFWGETRTIIEEDSLFDLFVPDRDVDLVQQITPRLEERVERLCEDPSLALSCPDGLRIRLTFEQDPYVLIGSSEERFWLQDDGRLHLYLPTPSLIGRPVDQAGVDVLADNYAAPIITQLIVELMLYDCCDDNSWMVQALIDKQLHKLDLKQWPLTAADYERFFAEPFTFSTYPSRLRFDDMSEERIRWEAYLLVDFIDSVTQRPLGEQFDLVMNTPRAWLDTLLQELTPAEREAQLIHHMFAQRAPQPTLQTALPDQSLLMMCSDLAGVWSPNGQTLAYDLPNSRWASIEPPLDNSRGFYITPDDTGILWTDNEEQGDFTLLMQYEDQVQEVYATGAEPSYFYLPRTPFDDRYLSIYVYGNGRNIQLQTHVVDINSCQTGDCQLQQIEGIITWSPDESRYMQIEPVEAGMLLTIKNAAGEMQYSTFGRWPYIWAADNTLIYRVFEERADVQSDLMAFSANAATPEIILTEAELTHLPTAASEAGWGLNDVIALPKQPHVLMFNLYELISDNAPQPYIVFYDWQSKELLGEIDLESQSYYQSHLSPNGRWLLLDFYEAGDRDYIIDLTTYEVVQTLPGNVFQGDMGFNARYDWSADGNWLVRFQRGFALLYTPLTHEHYPIQYQDTSTYCLGGGWHNRGSS